MDVETHVSRRSALGGNAHLRLHGKICRVLVSICKLIVPLLAWACGCMQEAEGWPQQPRPSLLLQYMLEEGGWDTV